MEISKRALVITLIIDLLLLVIGVVCLFVTKFDTIALIIFVGIAVFILISSILIWKFGKNLKNNNNKQ